MMLIPAGQTDVTTHFHLRLASNGTDATGLTITNFDLQYVRSRTAPVAKVDATALAATDSAHGDNQAIEIDATDQPGVYRVDWPDAAFASGVDEVILTVKVATVFTESLRVRLMSATRGLAGTALPNAAADAAGGLPISDAGGLDLDARIGVDIPAILVDTAEIGAAGAGLTNINLPNQTMDIVGNITGNVSGSVGSVTAGVTLAAAAVQAIWDALTSALTTVGSIGKLLVDNLNATISSRATQVSVDDLPTNAELATSQAAADDATLAAIAALNNLSAAQVNAEVDQALVDIHLDHLLAVDYDPASKPGVATALLNELVESDAGVSRYTANALEQAPTGGSAPTVQQIVDGVWDETLADHLDVGSTGAGLNAAGSAGDPWATAIPGAYGAGTAGKIVGDNVNATISSRASQVSVDDLPTNAELATSQAAADDATLAAISGLNNITAASVWAVGTRLLTAGTNIVLAKGTGVTGFNDLSAAQVNAEADTALADYDGPTHAELTAALGTADDAVLAQVALVKAKTDLIPAAPSAVGDIPTATENADELLSRDLGSGTGAGSLNERTVRSALRFNRNKFTIAGGVLTVYREDDATVAFTAAITQTAGDPVSASDPT